MNRLQLCLCLFILIVTLAVVQAVYAQQPDIPAIPGLRTQMALDYPDRIQQSVIGSGFEYTLEISGKHVERDGDRSTTHTAQVTARLISTRDGNGLQYSDSINGKYVVRVVSDDEVSTVTTGFSRSYSGNSPDKAECGKPIFISKKLGVAHFAAPTWKVVNFPTTSTYVVTNEQGTFTETTEQDTCFDIRIPDLASTNTAFAAAVRDIESKGNDLRMPLAGNVGPATFEVPWKGNSASGTFSVKVEALVSPSWINTNTPVANKYMRSVGGQEREDPLAAQVFPGTLTITWWIGARPQKSRLVLQPDDQTLYCNWLPTPEDGQGVSFATAGYNGEPLDVEARLEPEREGAAQPLGRLDFYLTDVSTNSGRCCNFPRSFAADPDLRFAAEQGDPAIKVDPADLCHAYTTERVEAASVTVEALDTGAYGRLEVRCDELSLVGEYKPTGCQYLAVPRDDDGNQVADEWEKRTLGGETRAAEWDEDPEPAGQATNGDSIGLYREYRGFCVLSEDGRRQFIRLNPTRKELFVIDKAGIFDTSAWGTASGILAYKVDDTLVHGGGDRVLSREVDYTMDEGGHVYAVRVESIPGMVDPEDGTVDDTAGYVKPGTITQPRDVTHCYIFPARHRKFIQNIVAYLQRAVTDPQGPEGQALHAAGLPPHLWKDALDHLDAARQEALAQQCIRLTVIHEVGHCCALPGHTQMQEDGSEAETSKGDTHCPMRYTNLADDLRFMVLQTIFKPNATLQGTYSSFCRQDFDCWSKLSLRD